MKPVLNPITGKFDMIGGGGDMLAATYDPQAIAGDAFDTDNHTDGLTNGVYTLAERSKLAALKALNEGIIWGGAISPPTLTGDVNNYAPTGFATATILRLTCDPTDRSITGIAGGVAGKIIVITNVGSSLITLVGQSPSSDAENRIAVNGNVVLAAGQGIALFYEGTESLWKPIVSYPNKGMEDPEMDGTAGPGDAVTFAAINHVHPSDTSHVAKSAMSGRHWLNFTTYGTAINGITANSNVFICSIDRTTTFVTWSQGWLVATTNDASNYWTVTLKTIGGVTINSFTTAAGSPGVWTLTTDATWDVANVNTTTKIIYIVVTKTGSPGALSIASPTIEVSV